MASKYMIVKTSAIGDVIQALCVAQFLKEREPDCQIDWVVERALGELLEAHPAINRVWKIDTKKWRREYRSAIREIGTFITQIRTEMYDAIFDLQGNIKSGAVMFFARSKNKIGFAWRCLPEKLSWLVANHHYPVDTTVPMRHRYLSLAQQFFSDSCSFVIPNSIDLKLSSQDEELLKQLKISTSNQKIMVAVGSRWPNKQMTCETLIQFLKRILQNEPVCFYFVWGSQAEELLAREIAAVVGGEMLGKLSLPLWQTVMAKMDLVIAMDSAALHLCATTATPTFSVFGASLANIFKPDGAQHYAVQGGCPYQVPFLLRCPHLRSCPNGACIRGLDADAIYKEFISFIKTSCAFGQFKEANCDECK